MADIAEAASISRATLYTHFKDKDTLLKALGEAVVADALQQMRDAWHPDAAFGANVEAAVVAKDLPLHRLKHTTVHGGALLAASEAVHQCARALEGGFVAFLDERATEAANAGRRFEVFGGTAAFAVFVAQSAAGFKDAIDDEASYRTALRTLATLIEASTSAGPAKSPRRRAP